LNFFIYGPIILQRAIQQYSNRATFCAVLAGTGVALQRGLLVAVLQNKTKHSTALKTLVKLNIHVSKLPNMSRSIHVIDL
jgi:hypothetical protein